MDIQVVKPWEDPAWDAYLAGHPGATMYHTSAWCSIVSEIGGYAPLCLTLRDGDAIQGLLPLMHVRSALTGNRVVALPFSDECSVLADDWPAGEQLIVHAGGLVREKKVRFLEIRGEPRIKSGGETLDTKQAIEALGYSRQDRFNNYVTPLQKDTKALYQSMPKTAVRYMVRKGLKVATVRRGEGESDLAAFYRLYVMNRRHHGIPPQPRRLLDLVFERMTAEPRAVMHVMEYDNKIVSGLINIRYGGVTYAKFVGIDDAYGRTVPVQTLHWKCIEAAAESGDASYDWGRTAADNKGLNDFKSRWADPAALPYFFKPPVEGLSIVSGKSVKYRLFTSLMRRLPLGMAVQVGSRIFRHFG